ncbi:MAG: proteasome accessory factor PafA2 family protein [Myxococcota bacterium]|nr:proteasome accessory factor PafA2 family protein [Myxococcota bacterium]
MSRDFLIGQETEYAISFVPEPGNARPNNKRLFQALKFGISSIVKNKPSDRHQWQEQFFVENGGSFNYEAHPFHYEDGLLEGATPECKTPEELLLYQKAQESILMQATDVAEEWLLEKGHAGRLRLIKNCRDYEGNLYGAQENYELLASNKPFRYRLLLPLCLIPFIASFWLYLLVIMIFFVVSLLTIFVGSIVGFLLFWILFGVLSVISQRFRHYMNNLWSNLQQYISNIEKKMEKSLVYLDAYVGMPLYSFWMFPTLLFFRFFSFQPYRKQALSFFLSRSVISGAGSLMEDGGFALSEKAVGIKRLYRWHLGSEQRALFDDGNLIKQLMLGAYDLLYWKDGRIRMLFFQKQRMQLGMSDSNMSQIAEYLKWGTSLVVFRMAEEGFLKDAPVVRNPIASLRKINADSTLQQAVQTQDHGEMTALDLQQWYCERAKTFLAEHDTVSMEWMEIVRLWSESLSLLREDPSLLFGRLDWVTKKYLIQEAGEGLDFAARKRIDIQYHELGTGFFARLEAEDLSLQMVEPEAVARAVYEPSSPDKVQLRSRYIQQLSETDLDVVVNWDNVYIGTLGERKVIDLNAYRNRRTPKE